MTAQILHLPGRGGLYETVIAAAGGRCECTGRCGTGHASGQGRCLHGHQAHRPLHAIARDPAVDELAAARLPVGDLMAVCGPCYDGAASQDGRQARSAAGIQGALFGGDAP